MSVRDFKEVLFISIILKLLIDDKKYCKCTFNALCKIKANVKPESNYMSFRGIAANLIPGESWAYIA